MKIHQVPIVSKKAIIISIVCVVLVAMIVVGGWSFAAIQAESAFASGITSVRQQVKTELQTGQAEIKAASAKSDTKAVSNVLDSLANKLSSDAESAPEPGKVLGLSLVAQSKIDDKKALLEKVKTMSSALKFGSEVLAYENAVIEPLLQIKNLSGKNLEEQQALAAGWLTMLNQLKKITPPDIAVALHASIIKEVAATQATLALMPDLYKKKDQAGFTAKSKELQVAIARLQSLHDVVQKLNTATDKAIGDAYQALNAAVQ